MASSILNIFHRISFLLGKNLQCPTIDIHKMALSKEFKR
jgi:hypothetical protein